MKEVNVKMEYKPNIFKQMIEQPSMYEHIKEELKEDTYEFLCWIEANYDRVFFEKFPDAIAKWKLERNLGQIR